MKMHAQQRKVLDEARAHRRRTTAQPVITGTGELQLNICLSSDGVEYRRFRLIDQDLQNRAIAFRSLAQLTLWANNVLGIRITDVRYEPAVQVAVAR